MSMNIMEEMIVEIFLDLHFQRDHPVIIYSINQSIIGQFDRHDDNEQTNPLLSQF